MKYIECPQKYIRELRDKTLFLAGGITNCSNWQLQMVELLKDTKYTIFNPRRENFGLTDSRPQIEWEYRYLSISDVILFWFTEETVNPITLFEYGKELARQYDMDGKNTDIFVGCHPNYIRKEDLLIQTELENSNIKIVHSLEELAEQVINAQN